MNLALEKGERVTTGGKGRGEAGEVTGVVADVPTVDSLGKRYGAYSGWGMKELLVVSGLDVDRCAVQKLGLSACSQRQGK